MYDDPHDRYSPDPDWHDRLRHLVLVDGRLVDTWTEPIEGTRWEVHARRFDEAQRRAAPPAPPEPPPYERALLWLEDACGGRDAVLALDAAPLDDADGPGEPEAHDPADRERLAHTAELLDGVAATVLSDALGPARADELGIALRRALRLVWQARPDVVRRPRSAQHLAGTLCWVVGKANGVFWQWARCGCGTCARRSTSALSSGPTTPWSRTRCGACVRATACGSAPRGCPTSC